MQDDLILEHLPMAKKEVRYMRLPNHVDRGDFESAAAIGLIHAARQFKPSLGVQFKTYAKLRIQGAILDEVRKMDWMSRRQRQRDNGTGALLPIGDMSEKDDANTALMVEVGRKTKTDSELDQGVFVNELAAILARAMDGLSEREHQVISLYFWKDRSLEEIGEEMSVTVGRVSQIKTSAIGKMKSV
ncbi:MAG: sigma-70 family RNA polymerase sigma factor, partial [bacterium]|nr:sigma-70 family RNA polymerase sigma factor [bacterium]